MLRNSSGDAVAPSRCFVTRARMLATTVPPLDRAGRPLAPAVDRQRAYMEVVDSILVALWEEAYAAGVSAGVALATSPVETRVTIEVDDINAKWATSALLDVLKRDHQS